MKLWDKTLIYKGLLMGTSSNYVVMMVDDLITHHERHSHHEPTSLPWDWIGPPYF